MRMMETGLSDKAYGEDGEVRLSKMVCMLAVKVERGRYWSRPSVTESFVPAFSTGGCEGVRGGS
jgi:hypothetical protein